MYCIPLFESLQLSLNLTLAFLSMQNFYEYKYLFNSVIIKAVEFDLVRILKYKNEP